MASKAQKGKYIVRSSESSKKRVFPTTRVTRTPAIPRGQTCMYGFRRVEEVGKKWFSEHIKSMYAPDKLIYRESLNT